MGSPFSGADDLASVQASGTLSSATAGAGVLPVRRDDAINISVWGTFVGSVRPERTFDAGANWLPLTYADGSTIVWTTPATMSFDESERGVLYRVNCPAYTSGTISWRISQ